MDIQKVNTFLMTKGNMFPQEQIPYIKEQLLYMSDDKASMLYATDFKNPTTVLIVSLLVGELGIDRFYIGNIGLGVAKLIFFIVLVWLCGVGVVWWFIDLFLICGATKEANFAKFSNIIAMYGN